MQDEVVGAQGTAAEPHEVALVRQAKAGSAEAWTEIYTSHYSAIYRYIIARTFNSATAEDLTSAVFLGALKGIASYRYRGRPLLAWLYRIARNVVADHQRQLLRSQPQARGWRLPLPERLTNYLPRLSRHDPIDLDRVASSEGDPAMMADGIDLRDALAVLPASQREVIYLRFMAGLSAEDVAQVLGKKPAAVYSLQARAILSLRKQLS